MVDGILPDMLESSNYYTDARESGQESYLQ